MANSIIKISCECGRKLTLQDDLAGKLIRCPSCREALRVPAAAAHEHDDLDFDDDSWDSSYDEPPPRRRHKSSAGRSRSTSQRTRRQAPRQPARSSGWTFKQVAGLGCIALGSLMAVGIVYFSFKEQRFRMLRGLFLPVIIISMGAAWVRGKSFGD